MDKKLINKKAEEAYDALVSGATPTESTFRLIALHMYHQGYKDAYESAYNDAANEGMLDYSDEEFLRFWNLYDKKVSVETCRRLWRKIPRKDRAIIFRHIPLYKECQPDKRYRKNPATYLRNKGWLDELIPSQYAERQFQSQQRTSAAEQLAEGLFGLHAEE